MATTLKGVGLNLHPSVSSFDLDFIISQGGKTKGPQLLDATRWIDLTTFPPIVTTLIPEKKKKKSEEEEEEPEEEEEESEKFERLYQLGDKSWVGIIAKGLNSEFYSFKTLPPKLQDGVLINQLPPDVNNFIGVIAGRIFVLSETAGYIQISGTPDSEWIETKELPLPSSQSTIQSFVFHLPPLYPRSQPQSPSPFTGLWWDSNVYLLNLQTNKFQKLPIVDGDSYDEKTKTYSDFKFLEVFGDDQYTTQQTLSTVKGRSFFIMSGCLYETRWEADSPPPYDVYGDSSTRSTTPAAKKGAPKVVTKKKGKKGKEEKEAPVEVETVPARLVVYRHLPWMDSIIGVADCDPLGLFLLSIPNLETEDSTKVVHVYRPAAPKEPRDKGTLAQLPVDIIPKERDCEIITYSEPANTICFFLTPDQQEEDDDGEIPRGDIIGLPTRIVNTLKFQPVAELYDAKALAIDSAYKVHVPKQLDAFDVEPLLSPVSESYPKAASIARITRIKEMYRPKLPSDDYHVTVHWKCPAEFLASDAKELDDLSALSDYLGAPLWYQTQADASGRVIHFANLLDFAKGRRSSKRVELLTLREQLSIPLSSFQWVGIIEKRTSEERKLAKSSPKKPTPQAEDRKEEKKYQAICKEWGYTPEQNTFLVPSGDLLLIDPQLGCDPDNVELHGLSIANAATGKWIFKFKPGNPNATVPSGTVSQLLAFHHSVASHPIFSDDWSLPKGLEAEEEEQKEETESSSLVQGKKRKNPPQGNTTAAKKTKTEEVKPVQVSLPPAAVQHSVMQVHKLLLNCSLLPDTVLTILEYLYTEIAPPADLLGEVDLHQASSPNHEWKVCAKQPGRDSGVTGIFDSRHYFDNSIAPNPYRGKQGRSKFAFEMDSKDKVVSDSLWEEMIGAALSENAEDEEVAKAVPFGALSVSKLPAVCLIKAVKTPADAQAGKVGGGHKPIQVETVVAIKILFTDALEDQVLEDEEGFDGEMDEGGEGGEGEEGGEGGEGEEGGEGGEGGEGEGEGGEAGEGEGDGE